MKIKISDILELSVYVCFVVALLAENVYVRLGFTIVEIIMLIAEIIVSEIEDRKENYSLKREINGNEENGSI